MAEQRFRFRLPWQPSSRPSQATQATSSPARETQPAAPAQRRPFRPGGSAQPPTARVEPPPVSPSSTPKGPASRTTSRSASKSGITPSPEETRVSPSRAVPQTHSPSPPREDIQQAKSIGVPTPPPDKEQREQKPSLPTSEKPQSMDTIQYENELLALEETKLPQPHVSVLEPEYRRESRTEVYEASSKEPVEILKGIDYEELKKKAVTWENGQGSYNMGQHPREDVLDRKEISEEYDNKREQIGYEHKSFNHKHESIGEKASLDKEIKENLPKIIHKIDIPRDKYALNEKPFSITTLTGENTGATMHLSSEPAKRERPIHIHRGYRAKLDDGVDPVADNEGTSRGRKPTNTEVAEDPGKTLCVNNNAQGINNSLIFHSSVTERNPGAHVVLSYKVAETGKTGKEAGTHETRKAEVSATSAERVTYAPNIRRRCLRGLFLESSDSDPGNSEKPRRHGCQAGCPQKSNDGFD